MRYGLIVLWMLFLSATSAVAQVSVGIAVPGVSIGINLPVYPELILVPGYPVYYAPRLPSNFFFYDGLYWIFVGDDWYESSWYNGPWYLVDPEVVPFFLLRIPVRYYRHPPVYFRGWRSDAPPRWGEHWGDEWEQRRHGWERWNRRAVPAAAPLPVYQRQYSEGRYPRVEQQQALRSQNYRYQPRDALVRQHFREQAVQGAPQPFQREQQGAPRGRSPRQQDVPRLNPPTPHELRGPAAPRSQPPQQAGDEVQRSVPAQGPPRQRGEAVRDQRQPPPQGATQREQPTPRSGQEDRRDGKDHAQQPKRGHGQEKDRNKGEDRGDERAQERNK